MKSGKLWRSDSLDSKVWKNLLCCGLGFRFTFVFRNSALWKYGRVFLALARDSFCPHLVPDLNDLATDKLDTVDPKPAC